MDDSEEYQGTLAAMDVIGLTAQEKYDIHRILAAILWLGNTEFDEGDNNSSIIRDENGKYCTTIWN